MDIYIKLRKLRLTTKENTNKWKNILDFTIWATIILRRRKKTGESFNEAAVKTPNACKSFNANL